MELPQYSESTRNEAERRWTREKNRVDLIIHQIGSKTVILWWMRESNTLEGSIEEDNYPPRQFPIPNDKGLDYIEHFEDYARKAGLPHPERWDTE